MERVHEGGGNRIGMSKSERLAQVVEAGSAGEEEIGQRRRGVVQVGDKVPAKDALSLALGPIDAANILVLVFNVRYAIDNLTATVG